MGVLLTLAYVVHLEFEADDILGSGEYILLDIRVVSVFIDYFLKLQRLQRCSVVPDEAQEHFLRNLMIVELYFRDVSGWFFVSWELVLDERLEEGFVVLPTSIVIVAYLAGERQVVQSLGLRHGRQNGSATEVDRLAVLPHVYASEPRRSPLQR